MKKFIFSLLAALFVACGIGLAAGTPLGVLSFAASLTDFGTASGTLRMAVNVEIWQRDIVENLFKNNDFIMQSVDESQYVMAGSVVHIPQAGAPSGAQRNRTKLPATVTRRGDTDVTYALDEITTDPRYIPNADTAELSYDKRQSCMADDQAAINEIAADNMLYKWRPTYYIKTTGDAKAAHYGTGNRKGVKVADFKTAKKVFNKWGIPEGDRFVILDCEMISQLQDELLATTSRDVLAVYDPVTGKLRGIEGFVIYERSTVLLASNQTLSAVTGTDYFKWTSTDLNYTVEEFKAIQEGGAVAATAAAVGLFWSKTAVSRALGTTKMFENNGDATYYGDVYSFLQRIGGRARRGDGKGVLGLIQITA